MSQLLKWMAFGSHFIWRGLSENYLTGWTIISRPLLWAQMTLDFSRYVPTFPVYLFLFLFPFLSSHTQTLLFLSEINTFSWLELMPLCSHVSELYLCILLQALAPYIWIITMVHRLQQRCGAKHRRLILSKTKMAFGYVLRVAISKVDMQVVA